MAEIYALLDPDTGALRYIGKANSATKRLASHLRDCKRRSTPLYAWVRKLVKAGKRPDMVVLEEACADWRVSERHWIARARAAGLRLLNLAEGGDQPLCPPEVRRRNARFANDPAIRAYRECCRQMGEAVRFAEKRGKPEKAARFQATLDWLRSLSREEKIRISQHFETKWGARHG